MNAAVIANQRVQFQIDTVSDRKQLTDFAGLHLLPPPLPRLTFPSDGTSDIFLRYFHSPKA